MIARAINQTAAQPQQEGQPEPPDPATLGESRAVLRAQQWRARKNLTDLPLPSGLVATVATPDLIGLQRDGKIPAALADPVARYLFSPETFKATGLAGMAHKDPLMRLLVTADMYAVIDATVVAACVLPKVSFAPDHPDTLHPGEIDIMDRMAIWEWATGMEQGTIAAVLEAAQPQASQEQPSESPASPGDAPTA